MKLKIEIDLASPSLSLQTPEGTKILYEAVTEILGRIAYALPNRPESAIFDKNQNKVGRYKID